MNPMTQYISEFVGMALFISMGSAVSASCLLKNTMANGIGRNWVMIAFGWGLAVGFGVYTGIALGGPAHLNPALSIGFAIMGMFPWELVPGFVIAQILGAFFGAAVTMLHFYPHFKITSPEEGNVVGIFATGPAIDNPVFNFISELIASFAFVFALLCIGKVTDGMFPFIVAMLIVVLGFSYGSTTGYAMNPARDFGPRLAYYVLPVPNKGGANWKYAWIPATAPILGCVLAVSVLNMIK